MRERPAGPVDVTHTTLAVLCIAVLAAASFQVLSPFLTAILWAGIISVTAWPLVLRLDAALGGRRGLTVTIITVAILLLMFVPLVLAIGTIVDHAQDFGEQIRFIQALELPPLPAWVERLPIVGRRAASEWTTLIAMSGDERAAMLAPYLQSALRWMAAEAGSVGAMLLQFLLTAIITAIMLANGETVRNGVASFARRLAGQQGVDAATLAASAVRGVVLGVVGTALIHLSRAARTPAGSRAGRDLALLVGAVGRRHGAARAGTGRGDHRQCGSADTDPPRCPSPARADLRRGDRRADRVRRDRTVHRPDGTRRHPHAAQGLGTGATTRDGRTRQRLAALTRAGRTAARLGDAALPAR
jgi:AI-2E family transporter